MTKKIRGAKSLFILFTIFFSFDIFLYNFVFFTRAKADDFSISYLDVGQGDAALLTLPDGNGNTMRLLIDGGPDNSLLRELGKIVPESDRRLDLLMMTHPQLDHFGGFTNVMSRYEVGAFIGNLRKGTAKAYTALHDALVENQTPYIQLAQGDRIHYGEATITLLSPTREELLSGELNDTCLVALLVYNGVRALFVGDIGENIERRLVRDYDLTTHVLKVGHHGSRFSSSDEFLRALKPKLAIIEVGAKNTYGHPTQQTLDRLRAANIKVLRTDKNGLVTITLQKNGALAVESER